MEAVPYEGEADSIVVEQLVMQKAIDALALAHA